MDIQEHQKTWQGFMTFTKVGTIFVIVVLALMALILI